MNLRIPEPNNGRPHGNFDSGELDDLLAEGESSGLPLEGEKVLAELKKLRHNQQKEEDAS